MLGSGHGGDQTIQLKLHLITNTSSLVVLSFNPPSVLSKDSQGSYVPNKTTFKLFFLSHHSDMGYLLLELILENISLSKTIPYFW